MNCTVTIVIKNFGVLGSPENYKREVLESLKKDLQDIDLCISSEDVQVTVVATSLPAL
jgi:hypothetical protein